MSHPKIVIIAGPNGAGKTMTRDQQLNQAKDKDLPASLIAIQRAAHAAREAAVRTNTAIVVQRDQKLVRITAEELRKAGVK
ncbi:hypothetical protein [Variovorax sp. 770b2]|uniref:hypothetical protein n=1 Tax=Variovorax sp. 770b2 TaxID=1566271 RepID=UPI0008E331F7|nr:hypothetical protein [Variovorax sp. 770b2]SFQ31220.1 hypothetical protein SAMN03159339_6659 [Variovorax sp. 770b2]